MTSKFGKRTKSRIRLIFGALIMLILALGFNALLTSASLEKLYVEAIVSKYDVIAKDLQRNLENSLRFGKSLEKFIGMEKLLKETQRNLLGKIDTQGKHSTGSDESKSVSEKDIVISISKPNGYIFYSTDKQLKGTKMPDIALIDNPDEIIRKKGSDVTNYVKHKNFYIHSLPIKGGWDKKWIATAVIAFSEKQVKNLLHSIMIKNIKIITIIILCGAALLIFLLNLIIPNTSDIKTIPKLKVSIVLFSVIVLSQVIFTGFNTNAFKDYYLEISMEKNIVLSRLLKQDIEYLLNKGIRIDRLFKMDKLLGEIIEVSPELDSIMVTDSEKKPLYVANKNGMINFVKIIDKEKKQQFLKDTQEAYDPKYHLNLELMKDQKVEGYISADTSKGFISTNISKRFLFNKLKEITLDSITVLAISIFFFVELLILELQLIEKQLNASAHKQNAINFLSIRPVYHRLL